MRLLFLDFETYYADDYSLSKMPTPNYIQGDRYETILCAVKNNYDPARIIDGPDFPAFLRDYDPAHTVTVTYNALFDNAILAWRYGFVPALMLDALGMARALRGHILTRFNLATVAKELGLGEKGNTLLKVKGLNRQAIKAAGLWSEFCQYALQDVELCAKIFFYLYKEFPASERHVLDLVLRCAIQPQFLTDVPMLREHLTTVQAEKALLLARCGVDKGTLMSTAKFKQALEDLGVEVQTKFSPTGNTVPQFARTDPFMAELQEHEDPRVQVLAAARLGHKSTIEETRAEKILGVAACMGGQMPIPLRYGAAHTHRLGGEWKMNFQNLPRVKKDGSGSKLRFSLIVPPEHSVVVCDLGQIEARLVAWICGCDSLLGQFRDKRDPYAILASQIFGFPVDRKQHIVEGFIGKTGILGLGYGCGSDKFYSMVLALARNMGVNVTEKFDRFVATVAVGRYRRMYREIPAGWRRLAFLLETAFLGKSAPATFGPVLIGHGYVKLPNAMRLSYADAKRDEDGETWALYGRERFKLWGGAFLENIVQALARIIVMDAALRIHRRGFRFALQAHDELVYVVNNTQLDIAKKVVHEEMVRNPTWAPGLPLAADIGTGKSYGDAK